MKRDNVHQQLHFQNLLFLVSKVIKKKEDSVEISWTAPFFPIAGEYSIYHTSDENKSISIINVKSNNVTTENKKYNYLSQPLNPTNITFRIRGITLDDAGYYAGGTTAKDAWSGGGVVLIVLGRSTLTLLLLLTFFIFSSFSVYILYICFLIKSCYLCYVFCHLNNSILSIINMWTIVFMTKHLEQSLVYDHINIHLFLN